MTEYKNQHWIPKAYLKAWRDHSRKGCDVHLYSPAAGYCGFRPYSRLFSHDELYTVVENGERNVSTEKWFNRVEDLFLRHMRHIKSGGDLPNDTKDVLAVFVAAMRNRSPAARDHWQDFKDRVVAVGDDMQRALDTASPTERERMTSKSIGVVRTGSRSFSLKEARAAAAEPFGRWVTRHIKYEAKILRGMTMTLIKAPSGIGFITSDNPVQWFDGRYPLEDQRQIIGLGMRTVEVTTPLDPDHCVLFRHAGPDGRGEAEQATVDQINTRTLAGCEKFFVARSANLEVTY